MALRLWGEFVANRGLALRQSRGVRHGGERCGGQRGAGLASLMLAFAMLVMALAIVMIGRVNGPMRGKGFVAAVMVRQAHHALY
jgi:hypothetical protein